MPPPFFSPNGRKRGPGPFSQRKVVVGSAKMGGMSPLWQQIAVYAMLVIAGAIALWSGISAWRAIRRGECGHCPGCEPQPPAQQLDSLPERSKERVVFLPSDDLRSRISARRK